MYTAKADGTGRRVMTTTPKNKEELERIAHKLRMLRNLTTSTGFLTTRSVGQMLETLTADELVTVQEMVEDATKD